MNNKIIALDTQGKVLWHESLPAASFSTPAVHNDMVFVGCDNMFERFGGSLYAFDKNSGEEIWNTSIGLVGRSSPVVYGGNVLIITKSQVAPLRWNTNLFVIDEMTGEMKWNRTLDDNITGFANMPKDVIGFLEEIGFVNDTDNVPMNNLLGAITPVIHNGVIFAGSSDGNIYAIDSNTGSLIWTFDTSSSPLGLSNYMAASPVIADGIVYAISGDGVIYAIDEITGEEKWTNVIEDEAGFSLVVSSPIVSNGFLYVNQFSLMGRNLYCIGSYKENLKGRVISKTIEIPKGFWWDRFKAETFNTTGNDVVFLSLIHI